MSPREALSEAERVATNAERRCRAILSTFANRDEAQPGTRCQQAATDGELCWTHSHAARNGNRARALFFSDAP